MSSPTPQRPSRAFVFLPIAVAALSAVLAAQMIARDPRFAVPLLGFAVLLFAPTLLGRWRMKRLLLSGDVERVIGSWQGSIERVTHHETMGPLLQATAYASYGWVEAARRALDRAVKGPAWDAALEQRLFVEALLDAFEGERDAAMHKAEVLQVLPMPSGGPLARRRVAVLRRGLAALARAFAHASAPRRSCTGRCAMPRPSWRSTTGTPPRWVRSSPEPPHGPRRARSTPTMVSCCPVRPTRVLREAAPSLVVSPG
jgi:hypothetical protein